MRSPLRRWEEVGLLTTGWLFLVAVAADLPSAFVGFRYGERSLPWDIVTLVYSLALLVALIGFQYRREWALRTLGLLLVLGALRAVEAVVLFRGATVDRFGWGVLVLLVATYPLLGLLLWRAGGLTRIGPITSTRWRAPVVVLAVALGLNAWIVSIVDLDHGHPSIRTGASRSLDFLRSSRTWDLERLVPMGFEDGQAHYAAVPAGHLLVESSAGEATLVDLPAFRNLEVKIDLDRGGANVGGRAFAGIPFETGLFLWSPQHVRGIKFERTGGWIDGTLTIAERADGKLFIVASPLDVLGKRIDAIYLAAPERTQEGASGFVFDPSGAGFRVAFPQEPSLSAKVMEDGGTIHQAFWRDPANSRSYRVEWFDATYRSVDDARERIDRGLSDRMRDQSAVVLEENSFVLDGRPAVDATYETPGRFAMERWMADPVANRICVASFVQSSDSAPSLSGTNFVTSLAPDGK